MAIRSRSASQPIINEIAGRAKTKEIANDSRWLSKVDRPLDVSSQESACRV